MEEFLQRWADRRIEKLGGNWDATQEVEQSLIAFQTLLEYHTDLAFDFFEAWSLRNIFTFDSELPVVVPYQAGLDLTHPPEREQEWIDEIADLRQQIHSVRPIVHTFALPDDESQPTATASEQTILSRCNEYLNTNKSFAESRLS
jgi:kinetochore protein Mis12/MTW1